MVVNALVDMLTCGGSRMIIIKKNEMISLLRNYRAERESIDAMVRTLSYDLDLVYAPPSATPKDVIVQTQYDVGKQIDKLLRQCAEADQVKRDTLIAIKRRTQMLDRIMLCLAKLPGDERDVLMATLVGRVSYDDYGLAAELSSKQVSRIRQQALDDLYDRLTRRRVEAGVASDKEA